MLENLIDVLIKYCSRLLCFVFEREIIYIYIKVIDMSFKWGACYLIYM